MEVSFLLSSHLLLPGEVYLYAAVHVMANVGQKYDSRLVYDLSYSEINCSVLEKCDWLEFYCDAEEALQVNVPEPWGNEVDICMLGDSDHAGDKVSHRSRSDFLMYVNTTPVHWFSKKPSTVETSVFSTESVAMKQGIDALRGLRYKLKMMGIPISGLSYIYGN